MRPIITFLLSFLFSFSVFSQTEISGRVLDAATRKPVEAATVTLHPAGSTSILTYSMTDKEGSYTLKRASMPDSVTISVRSMTIETQSKTVKNNVGSVEFLVKEKVTELKEVIVKAPKVRQLGDTIHYDVSSFLDETDKSIGDVLKKLPGVQVLSSGQILYQNKAISKFYVEGLDLLKGKYGIATNNIDAKNVASVQVLENHQPIKALKDMEIPEEAAINLKLKKSALGAFFATAQLGVGLPWPLLSNELVGMRFTQREQNMLVYKGDNTGRDIAQEIISFYGGTDDATTSFLNVVSPSPPNINRQHFLFNDAHLGSLNDLRTFKKDLTLTTNINYLFDKHTSDSYARRDVFVDGSENIRIEEDMNSRLLKRELEGAITLESNTDNYFLNNKLNLSSKWNDESGDVWTDRMISQRLKLPSMHAANSFDYVRRTGKKRFRIQSDVSYTTQENTLSVSPSIFGSFSDADSLMRQDILYNRFATNTSVSGSREGKVSLHYSAGVFSNHYTFQSALHEGLNAMLLST
ncbi:MAG: carboxypeptidase-like regulatory domain-containing protein, partial [Bacteroidales bacterium]|nr:carboxypeptidase-like regulatory domain-containing protein [Bacteroidales bacterium]